MSRSWRGAGTRLHPPQGWTTVVWELAIVVAGVLIALGAQQWVDNLIDRRHAALAKDALRDELATHYQWSVEWRVVEPCIRAQIDGLAARVLASGPTLSPAPAYSELGFDFYALRLPSRNYQDGVWRSALVDGAVTELGPAIQNELTYHYRQVTTMAEMSQLNNSDYQRLFTLTRPIPLDATVRADLLQQLDGLRGRVEMMSYFSAQLLRHIETLDMVPSRDHLRRQATFGTYRFCRAHGLPLRPLGEATKSTDT